MTTAKFLFFNMIKVTSSEWLDENAYFAYVCNNEEKYLWNKKFYKEGDNYCAEFYLEHNVYLGVDHYLKINDFITLISVKELPKRDEFDYFYYYDGELGSIVKDNETSFYLWAPLSTKVKLLLNKEEIDMERIENGVFFTKINRNCHGEKYLYKVLIDDEWITSIDPYGKTSTQNAKESVVVDFSKLQYDLNLGDVKGKIPSGKALVYELHIRDFSMIDDPHVPSELKNKYLFLTKDRLLNKKGNPIGLNYLKYLGVSHVQLLPVLDFATVDETNPLSKYNWGYDPIQLFTLEGSYASVLDDPFSRIIDFKKMIAALHKNGMRVILDVVYNHIYEYKTSSFEKIVPNYYFRRENDVLTNYSGCGDDFATERKMVRKIVVDSFSFLSKEYGIDGFRLDLMGLVDAETLTEVDKKLHEINKNTYLYGEGWNMFSKQGFLFGNIGNASNLKNYSFFNDKFRDIVKGNTFNKYDKGYALGNSLYRDGMKFLLNGSCNNIVYQKMFIDSSQSLNYVECHDNMTLFDKLSLNYENVENEFIMKKISLINAIVLLTPGISFIHMGQEFGQSKDFRDNTYKDNDGINYFNNDLYNQNFKYVKVFSELRKIVQELPYLGKSAPEDLREMLTVSALGISGLVINVENGPKPYKYNNMKIIINPSDKETLYYSSDDEFKVVFNTRIGNIESVNLLTKNVMVAPNSILILYTK